MKKKNSIKKKDDKLKDYQRSEKNVEWLESQSPRCVQLVETNLCHGWEPSPRPTMPSYMAVGTREERVRPGERYDELNNVGDSTETMDYSLGELA